MFYTHLPMLPCVIRKLIIISRHKFKDASLEFSTTTYPLPTHSSTVYMVILHYLKHAGNQSNRVTAKSHCCGFRITFYRSEYILHTEALSVTITN